MKFEIPLLEGVFFMSCFLKATIPLMKQLTAIEELYEKYFGRAFTLGLLTGTLVFMVFIIRMQGIYASVKNDGQIHYLTLIWLNLMLIYGFINGAEKTSLRNLLFGIIYIILIYITHDFFWLIKTHSLGIKLATYPEIVYPSQNYYLLAYSRWFILTFLSLYAMRKKLQFSKKALFFFTMQISYHLTLIYLKQQSPYLGNIFDSLPFLFIIKKGKGVR